MISHALKAIAIANPKAASTSIAMSMGFHHEHVSVSKCKERYEEFWKEYFKFTFVRDPMDRLISAYEGGKNGPTKGQTLEECCQHMLDDPMFYGAHGFHPQSLYIDQPEELDFIGRYENLANDYDKIARHLKLVTPLPHYNASSRLVDNRMRYYRPFVVAACVQIYKLDYVLFDYPLPVPFYD